MPKCKDLATQSASRQRSSQPLPRKLACDLDTVDIQTKSEPRAVTRSSTQHSRQPLPRKLACDLDTVDIQTKSIQCCHKMQTKLLDLSTVSASTMEVPVFVPCQSARIWQRKSPAGSAVASLFLRKLACDPDTVDIQTKSEPRAVTRCRHSSLIGRHCQHPEWRLLFLLDAKVQRLGNAIHQQAVQSPAFSAKVGL